MSTVSSVDDLVTGSEGTEIRDPDRPIVLLQQRICEKQADGSYQPPDLQDVGSAANWFGSALSKPVATTSPESLVWNGSLRRA